MADYNGSTVNVLLGNGDGTFGNPTVYATGDYPYSVALADLTGNGHLDIVCANLNLNHLTQGGTVSVLLGNGDGTFAPAVNYVAGKDLSSVVLADFNGDGKIDIATTDVSSSYVGVLLNSGNGTFQNAVQYPAGPNPFSLAAADFNGDGKLDLAVTAATYLRIISIVRPGRIQSVFYLDAETEHLPRLSLIKRVIFLTH